MLWSPASFTLAFPKTLRIRQHRVVGVQVADVTNTLRMKFLTVNSMRSTQPAVMTDSFLISCEMRVKCTRLTNNNICLPFHRTGGKRHDCRGSNPAYIADYFADRSTSTLALQFRVGIRAERRCRFVAGNNYTAVAVWSDMSPRGPGFTPGMEPGPRLYCAVVVRGREASSDFKSDIRTRFPAYPIFHAPVLNRTRWLRASGAG